MKKLIALIMIILVANLLTGCGLYDLSGFVLPDDLEFLAVIEELDTPKKIVDYMQDNFEYEPHVFYAPDPYDLWKSKKGDCNDFVAFAQFVANYHGIKTWQILIYVKNSLFHHVIAVYEENGKYNYSNNKAYYPIQVSTFKEVVEHCFSLSDEYEFKNYEVYDYKMNIVEVGN